HEDVPAHLPPIGAEDRPRQDAGARLAPLGERLLHQPLLLELVGRRASRRRARALLAADALDPAQMEPRPEEVPGSHVAGLFLEPEEPGLGIRLERLLDVVLVERIELLDAQDGDVVALLLLAGLEKIVIDLATAEQHPLRLLRRDAVVGNDALE